MKGHTGDIKNRGEGINFSVFFSVGYRLICKVLQQGTFSNMELKREDQRDTVPFMIGERRGQREREKGTGGEIKREGEGMDGGREGRRERLEFFVHTK